MTLTRKERQTKIKNDPSYLKRGAGLRAQDLKRYADPKERYFQDSPQLKKALNKRLK